MVEKGAATAARDRRARGGRIPTPPSLLSRHPPSSRSPPPPASPPCWTRRPPAALLPSTCRRTARPLASKPGSRRTRPRSPAMTCCKQRWEEGEGRGERRGRFYRGAPTPQTSLSTLSARRLGRGLRDRRRPPQGRCRGGRRGRWVDGGRPVGRPQKERRRGRVGRRGGAGGRRRRPGGQAESAGGRFLPVSAAGSAARR